MSKENEQDIVIRHKINANAECALIFFGDLTKEDISKEESIVIRVKMAKNPNTPFDILWELGEDKRLEVKLALAINEKCHHKIITKLACDKNFE